MGPPKITCNKMFIKNLLNRLFAACGDTMLDSRHRHAYRGLLHETGTNLGQYKFVIFAVVYMRLGQNTSLIT